MVKRSLGAGTQLTPTPVLAVGAYDEAGMPNAMIAAWGGIVCSRPPKVAVSLRSATYTHGCIVARGAFTISIPSADQVAEADYLGTHSGRQGNKFTATGLTAVRSDLVDAPYIGEFPLVLECRLAHTFELGLHTQFVGEVLDVKADEAVLSHDGKIAVAQLAPLVYIPSERSYYAVGPRVAGAFDPGRQFEG